MRRILLWCEVLLLYVGRIFTGRIFRVQLQLCGEFTYCKNTDLGPINLFEDVEVGVVGDDVLGIGGDSAIDELIVVDVLFYQPEMDVGLLEMGSVQPSYGFHDVVSYLLGGLLRKDFFVFNQYIGVDAKGYVATQHARPYLVVRAVGGQRLQEAVGVKYDSTHGGRGCACALRPIG